MHEREIIQRYFMPLATSNDALGLRDDAALLTVADNHQLVVTTDSLCENVHFLASGAPEDIAYLALASNVSDLAAMGATPHSYQLAIALGARQTDSWLHAFSSGLQHATTTMNISLSGGDTTRVSAGSSCVITITAHGVVPTGQLLTRSAAKPGDIVYVTGTLGDAALGLCLLQGHVSLPKQLRDDVCQQYWRPTPRVAAGTVLRKYATACMDISDGVLLDAQRICDASHIGMDITLSALPQSSAMSYINVENHQLWQRLISAGGDYELLFTMPPSIFDTDALAIECATAMTPIGRVTDASNVTLYDEQGTAITLPVSGYEH